MFLFVPEPDVAQVIIAHKSAFIHIATDAVKPSLTSVLPQHEVKVVFQHWHSLGVLSYHYLVAVKCP